MKVGRRITDAIGAAMPDWMYCNIVNMRCAFRGRTFRLSASERPGIYHGTRAGEGIQIARRNRFKRYDKGIRVWLDELARSYRLDLVPLSQGDRVIDCGANIGEIGVWARQFGAEYHAFEPEAKEADCCDQNNFGGEPRTNRKALWHEETRLRLFSRPETADSSLIENFTCDTLKTIETTTLANYINSLDDPAVRLLKVEAEGAEPEVLQGGEGMFHHVDYVAVDCGNERGRDRKPTFSESNDILRRHNFEVLDAYIPRKVFLFRRRDLNKQAA